MGTSGVLFRALPPFHGMDKTAPAMRWMPRPILVGPGVAMSPVQLRRSLFALALVAVPFPYWIVEGGRVPAVWLVALASLALTSALRQGGETSARISKWIAGQALLSVVLAWLLAWILAALLVRLVPARRRAVALAVVAAVAVAALCGPIFASTAVHGGTPTNFLGIFGVR